MTKTPAFNENVHRRAQSWEIEIVRELEGEFRSGVSEVLLCKRDHVLGAIAAER
ncbi:MAG: hypothetical protein R6V29_00780 [Spirochaetia bacterium]